MMHIGAAVLFSLGVSEIVGIQSLEDPETEEEFLAIRYTSLEPITWAKYKSQYGIVEKRVALLFIRQERNLLLQLSDWVMTYDVFQKLQNKDEWIAYRQALRDFPTTDFQIVWKSDGTLDLGCIIWPTKPQIMK